MTDDDHGHGADEGSGADDAPPGDAPPDDGAHHGSDDSGGDHWSDHLDEGRIADDAEAADGRTDAVETPDGAVESEAETGEVPVEDGPPVASEERTRMSAALQEIRREGWKAALLQAVVEATALFLAANLLLAALDPDWLPDRLELPGTVADPVAAALDWPAASLALPGSATIAAVVGCLGFAAAVWLRVRRPLVEQFEAVNPPVAEALRTARDAVESGTDTRMARRLYGTVLDRLGESSSLGLVDTRRVTATTALVVVLSLATLQVTVLDVSLTERPDPAEAGPSEHDVQNYTGLQDPDGILGAREDVNAGDEELTARVESSGGGREVEDSRQFPADQLGSGGDGTGSGVDGQQAGFAEPEHVEDAALVREYNRRIRESSGDGDTRGGSDASNDGGQSGGANDGGDGGANDGGGDGGATGGDAGETDE